MELGRKNVWELNKAPSKRKVVNSNILFKVQCLFSLFQMYFINRSCCLKHNIFPSKSTPDDGMPFWASPFVAVYVCPFLGQVSLNSSCKHRAQGKHFHVKPGTPYTSLYEHREPPTVFLVALEVCSHYDLKNQRWVLRTPLSSIPLLSPLLTSCVKAPCLCLIPASKIPASTSWATEVISAFTGLTICCLKCLDCSCKTATLSD